MGGTTSKDLQVATDAISVTNGLLNTGSSLVSDKELHKEVLSNIARVVACGELVKIVVAVVLPGATDPVLEKLNELDRKITQLGEKIANQFGELKAFISEHHFLAKYAQTASTMEKFLRNTMTHPSQHSVGNFKDYCEKHPPIDYAYEMISLLEHETTNPLKMAMQADKLKTRATFKKWRRIINDVLSQFLYMECMVSGMFMDKNMHNPYRLAEEIAKVNGKMDTWRNEYKKSYWPEAIKTLVYETQDNYTHVGNAEKADLLKKEIQKILTGDAFYIIVYNDCSYFENHCFTYNADQYFESFRRGKCNVVIYRSLNMNDWSNNYISKIDEDLDRMVEDVESCRLATIPGGVNINDFIGELMDNRISNAGMVGIIRMGHDVEIRSANSRREWGPGWWIKTNIIATGTLSIPLAYSLIAGYK